jgi:hypothetical protein
MIETPGRSRPIPFCPTTLCIPPGLDYINLADLRKHGRSWLDATQKNLPRESLLPRLRQALEQDASASRVLESLSPVERTVAAVYRRYGGSVDGEVIRIDLMARGLLEIQEHRVSDFYSQRRWKHNPIAPLADRWVLIPEGPTASYSYGYYYGEGPDRPFPRYSLHAGIARMVAPAGPVRWSIPPASGSPVSIARRSPAEVALDLSRVFAYLAGRGSVKVRADGTPALPTLRALEKAVPLGDDPEFPLPKPHGLYFDLLRYSGMIRIQYGDVIVDPTAAARELAKPGFWQGDSWARGWVSARHWFDGQGIPEGRAMLEAADQVRTGREVLAWALGCLARAGDHWYALDTLLDQLQALQNHHSFLPFLKLAWDPELAAAREKEQQTGEARQRAWWFSKEGAWYANALMVTLVTLGLVERGRLGSGATAPLGFRLTELGRAVFGAPETAPPPEPAERRCLVIQPNFDIVAYLDQADARVAGLLAQIAESDAAHSGLIQTFRLTQSSVYQAQESGLSHAQIVDFLQRNSQREPPANVLRSLADWSGKRESLSLRYGLTLLGFPTTAARDSYLNEHPNGTACGERFVLGTGGRLPLPGALVSDHRLDLRRTLELDEEGAIQTSQPMDLVQKSRLYRIARPPLSASIGWRLTGDSIRQAGAGGMKPDLIRRWLEDHLVRPAPPLMASAINAWLRTGRGRPLELGDAILLHVPDADQFQAIATSRRLRPFLIGRLGLGWLAVRKETRKELAALLEALGFTIIRELIQDELSLDGKPAAIGSALLPKARKAKAKRKR